MVRPPTLPLLQAVCRNDPRPRPDLSHYIDLACICSGQLFVHTPVCLLGSFAICSLTVHVRIPISSSAYLSTIVQTTNPPGRRGVSVSSGSRAPHCEPRPRQVTLTRRTAFPTLRSPRPSRRFVRGRACGMLAPREVKTGVEFRAADSRVALTGAFRPAHA